MNSDDFHNKNKAEAPPVYNGKLDWALNKKSKNMARVVYNPTHPNPLFDDERRGQGKNFAIWLFSEQKDTAENIFSNGLDAIIRARFEPNASIGYHSHHNTEEIYIILDGSITMTSEDLEKGNIHTELLEAGDAHAIKIGQAHYGVVGANGVEFISVILKK